jgi:hypothetical protein
MKIPAQNLLSFFVWVVDNGAASCNPVWSCGVKGLALMFSALADDNNGRYAGDPRPHLYLLTPVKKINAQRH